MPVPGYLALGGAALLPKLIDMFSGQGDQRTAAERSIQNKLMSIIGQGGVGLSQKQLGSRYQQMIEQLRPMFKAQQEGLDTEAAGRGIYKSGVALAKKGELAGAQDKQMANILQNLTQWNEEMKLNTLMQALGMGADVAGRYGDISRLSGAQNQMGFQNMWGNLLGLMVEKDLFNF